MTASYRAVNSILPIGFLHIIAMATLTGAREFLVIWIEEKGDKKPERDLRRFNPIEILRRSQIGEARRPGFCRN